MTEQEKDEGDLQYLLYGASELTKKKVKLTEYQLMERMMVFLKYKSRNMLRFVKDPLSLLLLMIKTGNYIVDVKWIIEGRGKGLDLARFASLWALNLNPEDVTKRHLLNVFFPRNYYDGPDADDPDCVIEEEENPVHHVKKPGREYSPQEVAELFDNIQHLPRHSLVSAYDSNDEFEDHDTTSKDGNRDRHSRGCGGGKRGWEGFGGKEDGRGGGVEGGRGGWGVESKLKSYFGTLEEEDCDFGHGGDGGGGRGFKGSVNDRECWGNVEDKGGRGGGGGGSGWGDFHDGVEFGKFDGVGVQGNVEDKGGRGGGGGGSGWGGFHDGVEFGKFDGVDAQDIRPHQSESEPPWTVRDPLYWEIDNNPSNMYESPNFTLKCKTKIVSHTAWLYNDSRMSRDRPTGRYYSHKRSIEEKAKHIKPVNVHALNFNTLLDDVRTIQVQTKLREAMYDLKYAPLWDEEGGDHDFLLYLNPGHVDRGVMCDMMRNRLERATSTLRDFVDNKKSRCEGDEFRNQDPWIPLFNRPPH